MLINDFETYCREQLGLSDHSLRAYRQDLNTFVGFTSLYKMSGHPTAQDIIAYQKDMRERTESSPATIRRRLITLRSYFSWLEQNKPELVSPFCGLRLDMKVPKRLPRPVDRPTLAMVFRFSPHVVELEPSQPCAIEPRISSSQITGLVTRLLVVAGLRISELTSLKMMDVSGAATRIRVRGKGNRERIVFVPNQRLQADFRQFWEHRLKIAGAHGWLFINSQGNQLSPQTYRKRLRKVSEKLLIEPYLTPHQFRHSAATLLIEEGVDIRLVQRLLGHASIATTELYTKVSDNSLVNAVERADTLSQVDF